MTPKREYKSAINVNAFAVLPNLCSFLLLENFLLLHGFIDDRPSVDLYRRRFKIYEVDYLH